MSYGDSGESNAPYPVQHTPGLRGSTHDQDTVVSFSPKSSASRMDSQPIHCHAYSSALDLMNAPAMVRVFDDPTLSTLIWPSNNVQGNASDDTMPLRMRAVSPHTSYAPLSTSRVDFERVEPTIPRRRIRPNARQLIALNEVFASNRYPSTRARSDLAVKVNMSESRVSMWRVFAFLNLNTSDCLLSGNSILVLGCGRVGLETREGLSID